MLWRALGPATSPCTTANSLGSPRLTIREAEAACTASCALLFASCTAFCLSAMALEKCSFACAIPLLALLARDSAILRSSAARAFACVDFDFASTRLLWRLSCFESRSSTPAGPSSATPFPCSSSDEDLYLTSSSSSFLALSTRLVARVSVFCSSDTSIAACSRDLRSALTCCSAARFFFASLARRALASASLVISEWSCPPAMMSASSVLLASGLSVIIASCALAASASSCAS
mmetsp:Transcript_5021/g.11746  ORF Transcript_5021/g.11746 Transcript_5021/m.11746 type:complete len:234 (+) Transcript_5021:882-1583(+)